MAKTPKNATVAKTSKKGQATVKQAKDGKIIGKFYSTLILSKKNNVK